ncbi:enoyl-CoA hydratase/isomerase family protein [Microbacterium sp.]|uniref:enoyl-CoA hydratase/isomerase family protein n=1 Tax=Microbacterium sp. TaxID=51671 RepID=UPI0037C59CF2
MAQSRILARVHRGVGHLTLNRPEALNALDLGMIRDLTTALEGWRDDPEVRVILLDGAGERGLCAGGDVRTLYDHIVAGRPEDTGVFFREEYALNALIAEYPKPFVAIADGITMGGGIGLAGHASIRVVTERSRLAMPETRIGFAPDVGGTWLLAHAPGRLGEHLGLTGTTMDAADAIAAGFADLVVPSDRVADLLSLVVERAHAEDAPAEDTASRAVSVLRALIEERLGVAPGPSKLEAARPWIDEAFAADTVAEIVTRLRARPEPEAQTTADTLESLSPTGLAVTLAAVRGARELPDLRAALAQEYSIVMWFATSQPDLVEGIRAQLVDKDRRPRWNPPAISAVKPEVAASALMHRPSVPLWS